MTESRDWPEGGPTMYEAMGPHTPAPLAAIRARAEAAPHFATLISALEALAEGPLPGLAVENIARKALAELGGALARLERAEAALREVESNMLAHDIREPGCPCGLCKAIDKALAPARRYFEGEA